MADHSVMYPAFPELWLSGAWLCRYDVAGASNWNPARTMGGTSVRGVNCVVSDAVQVR